MGRVNGKRIMIVDDKEDFAHGVAILHFTQMGHSTHVMYDGERALARAKVFAPDVTIVDFNMPNMNCHQLAEALRHMHPCESLFILCASGTQLSMVLVAEAGFDAYFKKPSILRGCAIY